MTKFWTRFCIKSAEKDYFHFLFSIHFSGAFVHSYKIIHSHNIHKIKTMTTVSYNYGLSDSGCLNYKLRQPQILTFLLRNSEKICHWDEREYLSFKLMFELSLNLWENLTSGFSKTRMYLISQIEESWRLCMRWVLGVEFWWQGYRNRRLHTDWVLHWFWAKCGSIGKNLAIIQDVLNSILSSLW